MKSINLTKEERDVLILIAPRIGEKHLSNSEIARQLDMPVSKVKTLIHQACVKLKAGNRIEAVHLAIRQGGMSIDDFYSIDELAEMFGALSADMWNKIVQHLVGDEMEEGYT